MGTRNTVSDADFSANAISFRPPVGGALYYNYLGGDAARTCRNLIIGEPAAAMVGTPTISASYASFAGNAAYLETAILDLADVTLIAVGRAPDLDAARWGFFLSDYAGPTSAGSSLVYSTDGTARLGAIAGRDNGSGGSTQVHNQVAAGPDKSTWAFMEARIGAGIQNARDWTRTLSTSAAPAAARVPNGTKYRIGAPFGGAVSGAVDVAFAAIYPRILNDSEMGAIYASVEANLAARATGAIAI